MNISHILCILTPCLLMTLTACGKSDKDLALPVAGDFARLNLDGSLYTGNGDFTSQPWHCISDKRTGLTWEIKSTQPGLHHKNNTYTWFNPDQNHNGGDAGMMNGGKCTGSACDTSSLITVVNKQGLCGFNDWRLPEHMEPGSINDPYIKPPGPTTYTKQFPNSIAAEYWTGSSYNLYPESAWAWNYIYGHDRVDRKKEAKHVRLVRGEVVLKVKD
jgi:hypothetical protein